MKFKLQNKFEGGLWGPLSSLYQENDEFTDMGKAYSDAMDASTDTKMYGAVRVIELGTTKVLATFVNGRKVV